MSASSVKYEITGTDTYIKTVTDSDGKVETTVGQYDDSIPTSSFGAPLFMTSLDMKEWTKALTIYKSSKSTAIIPVHLDTYRFDLITNNTYTEKITGPDGKLIDTKSGKFNPINLEPIDGARFNPKEVDAWVAMTRGILNFHFEIINDGKQFKTTATFPDGKLYNEGQGRQGIIRDEIPYYNDGTQAIKGKKQQEAWAKALAEYNTSKSGSSVSSIKYTITGPDSYTESISYSNGLISMSEGKYLNSKPVNTIDNSIINLTPLQQHEWTIAMSNYNFPLVVKASSSSSLPTTADSSKYTDSLPKGEGANSNPNTLVCLKVISQENSGPKVSGGKSRKKKKIKKQKTKKQKNKNTKRKNNKYGKISISKKSKLRRDTLRKKK